ncbi:unnamed protein product [Pseudo-nitzschia multistriata]|uniref:Uncharacterized protein n=1 Tax=Pseudo-nitzschia multistriata TaxID=183589 RepID=A0A448Z0V7_9STRA|nr:unnamed protein product [Pseudo-nitzschia multistriata]
MTTQTEIPIEHLEEKIESVEYEEPQTTEKSETTMILSDGDQPNTDPTAATTPEDAPNKSISFHDENTTEVVESIGFPIESDDDATGASSTDSDVDADGDAGMITDVTDVDAKVDADADPEVDADLDGGVVAVDTSAAACLEPEGTTPIPKGKHSRRFDDSMLDVVLADSGDEKDVAAGEQPPIPTPLEITENRSNVTSPMLEADPTDHEQRSRSRSPRKIPREPPGSAVKRARSKHAVEREQQMKKTTDNHHPPAEQTPTKPKDNGVQPEGAGAKKENSSDGDKLESVPSMPMETAAMDQQIYHEAMESTTLTSTNDRDPNAYIGGSENEQQPFESSQTPASEASGMGLETKNIKAVDNSGGGVAVKPIASNMFAHATRTTPDTLSPDLLLSDYDPIPIPLLPPLVVPQIGSVGSYDSLSMQGLHQPPPARLTPHNGYQHPLPQRPSFTQQPMQQQHQPTPQSMLQIPHQVATMPGGKRKIHLHLWEQVKAGTLSNNEPEKSGFLSFRRKKGILRKRPSSDISSPIVEYGKATGAETESDQWTNRGTLTVSWYEGTTSIELQEHVQNSVRRKLGLKDSIKLVDFRVLDESSDPPEEIVLCPYIPDGSRLTLRFATTNDGYMTPPKYTRFSDYEYSRPPDSPSAAPSPFPASVDLKGLGLNANQLALLGTRLNNLQAMPAPTEPLKLKPKNGRKNPPSTKNQKAQKKQQQLLDKKSSKDTGDDDDDDEDENNSKESSLEVASLHPEDQIQKSLREITSLLLKERTGGRQHYFPRPYQEKRQVVFVLANYFVLFLSLIAISAEIQARAPGWHAAVEQQLMNVQDCSKDKESLFQCVENGDMAGLVASVILWMSRSAATKRIFLFGFSSPNKLWTAVYESLVTSICWGFSYMFIRRGMNPDNNRDFLRRYWKDAVYGSLAGFNAAFMKQVLKNLIPQEVIEDALQERQLKILSWLPSFKPRGEL